MIFTTIITQKTHDFAPKTGNFVQKQAKTNDSGQVSPPRPFSLVEASGGLFMGPF